MSDEPRQTFSLYEAALYLQMNKIDCAILLRRWGQPNKGIPIKVVEYLREKGHTWPPRSGDTDTDESISRQQVGISDTLNYPQEE